MTKPIRLSQEAKQDVLEATEWYKQQKKELGKKFAQQIKQELRRIAANPLSHQVVYGAIRRAVVNRFPYIILYRDDAKEIAVLSVFHTSRDPSQWQKRIDGDE